MFHRKKIKSTVERKERTDKKIHVGPTVSVKLKQEIERIGVITDRPVKFIGEVLCYEGIHTPEVIALLASHFRRGSIRSGKTVYFGNEQNISLQERTDDDASERVSIRFTKTNYEDVRLLANALDVTPSRATAILLDVSIRYHAIIETILQDYNSRNSLDDVYTAEIRKLMKYVNHNNPYKDKSWNSALVDIVEVIKDGAKTIKNRPKLSAQVMRKIADTETYKWNLDDVDDVVVKKKKPRKQKNG